MNITLIGYGKMGKTIEQIALRRGHDVSYKIDQSNHDLLHQLNGSKTDVAIEFTQPEQAFDNLKYCLENGIPVVCGTTGWLEKRKEIEAICLHNKSAFFYASNYSVGVNIFFHLNKWLAQVMNGYPEYSIMTEEIHHTEKKDAPSGTSITLAEGILEYYPGITTWVNEAKSKSTELPIVSKRIANVPGTHTIAYESSIDTIEIKHTAHSREGFALGAVLAAEFIKDKTGVFGMDDLLQIKS
ncbi:MAG: dapB [Chitinophagaceae bacterium]|nr:dapB [Chitinophagaceae bacterium]